MYANLASVYTHGTYAGEDICRRHKRLFLLQVGVAESAADEQHA